MSADLIIVCPITKRQIIDPVVAADGYVYEKASIDAWIRMRQASPITGETFDHALTIPARFLDAQRVTLKTFVPEDAVSNIIGRRGSVVGIIEQSSETRISVSSSGKKRLVKISGPLYGARLATRWIQQIVEFSVVKKLS
jgi:hypothetical protein